MQLWMEGGTESEKAEREPPPPTRVFMTPTEGGRKEEVALGGFSSFTVAVVVVLYFPALRVMYAHTMPLTLSPFHP